jgi:hypothetical protein
LICGFNIKLDVHAALLAWAFCNHIIFPFMRSRPQCWHSHLACATNFNLSFPTFTKRLDAQIATRVNNFAIASGYFAEHHHSGHRRKRCSHRIQARNFSAARPQIGKSVNFGNSRHRENAPETVLRRRERGTVGLDVQALNRATAARRRTRAWRISGRPRLQFNGHIWKVIVSISKAPRQP